MKKIILALAALTLTPSLLAAGMFPVDGTWRVDGSVQGNPVKPVCVLVQKDGKITGSCTGTDGKPVAVTGTVTDKSIKWQYDTVYEGSGITISFTASFDKDDHLAGGIFVDPYAVDGGFTATRDKPVAVPPA